MRFKCSCGADKGVCVDCMEEFIERAEDLHDEVKRLCDMIVNSPPDTTIKGKIESQAFGVAHHEFILNA